MNLHFAVCVPVVVAAVFAAAPTAALATAAGANGRIAFATASLPKSPKASPTSSLTSLLPDGSAALKLYGKKKFLLNSPEYSPDGTKLAFLLGAYGDESKRDGVYVAAADGSGAKQIARTGWTDGIAWSPDGKTIAYTDVMDGLHTVPSAGGKAKLIVKVQEDGGYYRRPTYTPDGTSLLFERVTLGSGRELSLKIDEIWKSGVDGAGAAPLFAQPPVKFAGDPDVSPDGKTLLFAGPLDKKFTRAALYTVPLDGSAAVRTIHTTAKNAWTDGPTWSPDGTKIAVAVGTEKKGSSILLIDPATTAATTLQSSANELSEPTWQALPVG